MLSIFKSHWERKFTQVMRVSATETHAVLPKKSQEEADSSREQGDFTITSLPQSVPFIGTHPFIK